jgi:hypothetical protein
MEPGAGRFHDASVLDSQGAGEVTSTKFAHELMVGSQL